MAWTKQGNIKGPKGGDGARGSIWYFGTGAPTATNTQGALVNDVYLDLATGDVYQLS